MNIEDANDKRLRTIGYIALFVMLGTCVVQLDSVVCKSLAATVILGCDFCDRLVEAIRARARTAEMENGCLVPIFQRPLKSATRKRVPLTVAQQITNTDPISTRLRVEKSVDFPPETKVWVSVSTKHIDVRVV